jgi:hypothetical protein
MVLKHVIPALFGAALLVTGAAANAGEYRPDEFLGLDLSKAVLSPKPLGPPAQFAPVAVEAKSDVKSDVKSDAGRGNEVNWARDELKTPPKQVTAENVQVTHPRRTVHVASAKPKGSARIRLAHRHGNPLDAEAMDTRIQKWPCKSGGGICDWKR